MRKIRSIVAGAVATGAVATAMVAGASPAGAHHNHYINLYNSNGSVVSVANFRTETGREFGLSRGTSSCCYNYPQVVVGPAHDIIVTSREYPNYAARLSATGWHNLPRLISPSHLTVRIVNNGAS